MADESGKVSIVSIPIVGFVVVLIGFVINTGVSVREKLRIQNAADAAASTATLWMARSMNAVTATNHLLGEATAILVLFDGFGGPMLYELPTSAGLPSDDSLNANGLIEDRRKDAVIVPGGFSTPLVPYDKTIVTTVTNLVTQDSGRHVAGAALYDGKMTLKKLLDDCLFGKQLANIALRIAIAAEKTPAAPFALALESVAATAHVFLTLQIFSIGKEWVVLEGLERVVGSANRRRLITGPIADIVIPGLSFHADTVVGRTPNGFEGPTAMRTAIESSLEKLAADHGVDAIELRPAPRDLRLPVEAEPPSPSAEIVGGSKAEQARRGPWEQPKGTAWRGNYTSPTARAITEAVRPIREPLDEIVDLLEPLVEAASELSKAFGDPPDWLGPAKDILDSAKLFKSLRPSARWNPLLNPCYQPDTDERYRLPAFHWRGERNSQWVRATHPLVDDLRGGIVEFLRANAALSDIATHYVHWTDRYTLVHSHLFRKAPDEDEGPENDDAGPIAALRAKVAELRARFDRALRVDAEDSPDTPAAFEDIEDDFIALVRNSASALDSLGDWAARVTAIPQEVASAGSAAAASPPGDVTAEDARNLVEQLTRIALLDELLSLAETLVDLTAVPTPHMYVMQGMDGTNKGSEPWTKDPRLAGRLFGVLATAGDAPDARIFGRMPFHVPTGTRRALAGALLANGNGIRDGGGSAQKPAPSRQADTGWDTLNWQPPVEAWEWADHAPRSGGPSPDRALIGGEPSGRAARIRLGWQGLLVPIEGFDLRGHGTDAGDGANDPFADFGDLLLH